jgi:hypothetical protein
MHHNHSSKRRIAGALVTAIILACVLAACGSSSPSKTSSATASATSSTSTTGKPPAGFAGRFTALRECLTKHGITLPKRTAGQGRPRGGGLGGLLGAGGATAQLPKGVSRAQYEAVLKVCGGLPVLRGGTRGFGRLRSPQFKTALTNYAACLRSNGINLPPPNTSGSGPIFDTKGIDVKSAQFKAATAKCSSQLRDTFRRPGTAAPGAGGGAPSSGAGEPPAA